MKPAINKMPGIPRKRTAGQTSKEPSPPLTNDRSVSSNAANPGTSAQKYVKIPANVYEKMSKVYYQHRNNEKKRQETKNKEELQDSMFRLNYELNEINQKQQSTLRNANSELKYQKRIIADLERELKEQKELQQKIQQCNLLRYHIIRMEDHKLTKYHLLILYYDGLVGLQEWKRIETEFPRPVTPQIAIEHGDYFIKRYKIMRKVLKSCKCTDDDTTCDGCRETRQRFNKEMLEYKGRQVKWGFDCEFDFMTELDKDFQECVFYK